jgi:DNA-binding response OmpR family regulator
VRLLLVEDEPVLADALADGLRREGYAVAIARDGLSALEQLGNSDFDLLILDRDLPIYSGDFVCKTLRSQNHPIRILMLTAAGTLNDRVTGLDLGADDYLPKPFAYAELLARLRALGRRGTPQVNVILESGTIRIDTARHIAEENGIPLKLTPKEYGILEALLAAKGGWVSNSNLLDKVWDSPDDVGPTIVKATIHTLRRKLVDATVIESAPVFGYRIKMDNAR